MTPLVFTWPYWLPFVAVMLWAFVPEFRIIRKAQKAVAEPGSQDAGSINVITYGGGIASFIAISLAWYVPLRMAPSLNFAFYVAGLATIVAASLLRRHCFRQLGKSFTGDVRARADQVVVTSGAYSILRHPSYTAGIMMNAGMGLLLGNWVSLVLLIAVGFAVYAYRISVEERTLLAVIGEPYREFIRTRRRLIPFIY